MRTYRLLSSGAASVLVMMGFGLSGVAAAADLDTADLNTTVPATLPMQVSPEVETAPSASIGQVLDMAILDRLRGGDESFDIVENNIRVNGDVSNNSAERVVTGANAIQGGSFANANGINTVIQNSGANVLIQNAMVVNVQFAPSP